MTDRELLKKAVAILNTVKLNSKKLGRHPSSDYKVDYRAIAAIEKFIIDNHELALEVEFPDPVVRARIAALLEDPNLFIEDDSDEEDETEDDDYGSTLQ